MLDFVLSLMQRGGMVMWPLLALSLVSVALSFERLWFFVRTNHPGRMATVATMARLLRRDQRQSVLDLAQNDHSVYGAMLRRLLDESNHPSEAVAAAGVDSQRGRLERFMPTLSTIITAAPMLGILGTVLGIISSFEVLSEQTTATDPKAVSQGIAEALITTAVGLVISLITLFPYNAFRAQIDRTLTRLEALATATTKQAESSKSEGPKSKAGVL